MSKATFLLSRIWSRVSAWAFPLAVVGLYGVGWVLAPENTQRAIHICVSLFYQLALPISLALVMMVVFNKVLSPALVTRFLGHSSGFKGVVLSSLAGVLSMGPIYAWYPLFTSLKEKGASPFHIANFMGCRSIKPVLLPVLVAYFGWEFTAVFVLMCFGIALVVAGVVGVVCQK